MKKILGAALFAFPFITFAQTNAFSILAVVKNILDILIPLLITLALVYFIWGVIKYVISKDADDKEKSRSVVVRGIIGLFIIVSVWGIVGVIQDTFDVKNTEITGPNSLPDRIPDGNPNL